MESLGRRKTDARSRCDCASDHIVSVTVDLETLRRKADAVVHADLDDCLVRLNAEFREIAGKALLITGGAGFLGYYLVQSALHWNRSVSSADQIDVTVIDNYSRGVPEWLAALGGNRRLRLVEHDITQPLSADCQAFDYVIHAASIASPTFYRQHPIETMDANVNGLRILLELARQRQHSERPVRGFLFFSSSEIYGDAEPSAIPTPETYPGRVSSTGPRACYDESKRYGETLCVNFANRYGIPVTIARPFNNYGPGLKITDRRIIPDLAQDLLHGRNLTLHSDGSPRRTFCYSADAIVGYYKVLTRGRSGEAYNIGQSGPEVSMKELAERLATAALEVLGYQASIVTKESTDSAYLTDNPQRRCPDVSKARHELGFDAVVSVDEGLVRTLTWYAGNREGAHA
jgi:UDP-glucuronate decarboxylase